MPIDDTIAHVPTSGEPKPSAPLGDAEPRHAGPGGRYVYASGARPLEGYTVKRAIGRGGFGEVYYALTDAGKEVALKLVTRNLEVERRGAIQCMNLKSQHLIAIHDLRSNAEGDSFVIMEYVAGPSLASILDDHPTGLPLHEVRHWLKGLVAGVSYLHDHGIVHRDLKPANLFLEEGVVKIGDYGLSKAITNNSEPGHSQSVGTCHYMAPEIGTGKYHKPIDIYAMGVILYEMITGRVPFDGESVHEILMKHLTNRPDLTGLPDEYLGIVAKALSKRPEDRPARVTDMLLPADAPREPAVRFLGEGKAAGIAGHAGDPDEVLHIGPDDPILYIGPDTMPPNSRRPIPGGVGSIRRAVHALRLSTARPAASARVAPSAGRSAPTSTPEPFLPPPEPPPLPSGRVRVGELAASMVCAAPLAAAASVFSVPVFELLGGKHPNRPAELGLLGLAILVGVWGVLAGSKLRESGIPGRGKGRLNLGLAGLIVGAAFAGMVAWAGLSLPTGSFATPAVEQYGRLAADSNREFIPLMATTGAFFALTFAALGAPILSARDRRARFRFGPILMVGLIALIFGQMVPSPQPWGAIVAMAVAGVVQVVSPWSPLAAEATRLAKLDNRGCGGRRRRGKRVA